MKSSPSKPTKLVTQEAQIKSLLGRTAVIVVQTECEDDRVQAITPSHKFTQVTGFNNNIYNNRHLEYALTTP